MRIRADGNVGIGTDDPQSKLEIDGDISMNGDIMTTGDLLINTREQYAGGHFIKMHTGYGNDGGLFLYRGPHPASE